MSWHGWYNADPFWVYLTKEGQVRVILGAEEIYHDRLKVREVSPSASETQNRATLTVLPGNDRLPPFSQHSWINQRGRGQLVLPGRRFVFCRLNGRIPGPPDPTEGEQATSKRSRHPKAGLWLGLAADLAESFDLEILQVLTGYSYPTVREWARRETTLGHMQISFAGRTQQFEVSVAGRHSWWRDARQWWPHWRRPRWPKQHGPAAVHWARWTQRLPEHIVRGPQLGAPARPTDPAEWVWATGADHLTAIGKLIQAFDSDVWMSASAWELRRQDARINPAPRDEGVGSGTRVSVIADGHPVMRMLCARIGTHHPEWSEPQPAIPAARRAATLLDGLPLLDAVTSADARVAEQGRATLAELEANMHLS